jgi:CMP/dCMP kinase
MQDNKNNVEKINIIAIDGPTASGKGTIARRLAEKLNYNYLNSGALYRLVAFIATQQGIDILTSDREDMNFKNKIIKIGEDLINDSPIFLGEQVIYHGSDVWPEISSEKNGHITAYISSIIELRETLFNFQRSQIKYPGLVAEGRDMTSHVFTEAKCKIYLDASPEAQANRRLIDEQNKNNKITKEDLIKMMHERNEKDRNRPLGALIVTSDACYIDTSDKNREEVFELALNHVNKVFGDSAMI